MQERFIKNKCALGLILMLLYVCPTHAAKIVVSGKNESYAGETLELRRYTEKILNGSESVATAKVASVRKPRMQLPSNTIKKLDLANLEYQDEFKVKSVFVKVE